MAVSFLLRRVLLWLAVGLAIGMLVVGWWFDVALPDSGRRATEKGRESHPDHPVVTPDGTSLGSRVDMPSLVFTGDHDEAWVGSVLE